LPWQPILGTKLAYWPSFIALAFRNGLEYHSSDLSGFNGDDFSTSFFINLVKFGPVTPEFTRVIGLPLIDQQCSYFITTFVWQHHCWALWRSVDSFGRQSVLSFVSLLFARGDTFVEVA